MELLAQVTLPHVSGFVEDNVVNTFAIDAFPGFDPDTELLELSGPIAAFYTHVGSSTYSISKFLGGGLSRAALACSIKFYDVRDHLDGSPHGSPIAEDHFTLTTPVQDNTLPEEVAACITLRGDSWAERLVEAADGSDPGTAPDRPRSRYTGRLYIGPLIVESAGYVSGKARLDSSFRTTLLDATEYLQDQLVAQGHNLCVWSRANEDFVRVTHAQVDDAFDTQRRRGGAATSRTTRTIIP